ncbi:hypothetical protein GCM10011515_04790 [Tsuneonella deserti]|uniref:Uncharacterized protein n=1 Tax=Tsuneonella deserti TaxID=2035528 RepID=A0ABQ1S3D3_9SPHN|nr:hypothetical protein GCM10011515_04790 [Tsuneonella deserti]
MDAVRPVGGPTFVHERNGSVFNRNPYRAFYLPDTVFRLSHAFINIVGQKGDART